MGFDLQRLMLYLFAANYPPEHKRSRARSAAWNLREWLSALLDDSGTPVAVPVASFSSLYRLRHYRTDQIEPVLIQVMLIFAQ